MTVHYCSDLPFRTCCGLLYGRLKKGHSTTGDWESVTCPTCRGTDEFDAYSKIKS